MSLQTVGFIGVEELDSPQDVAFDEAGRLLVADSGNDVVAVYRVDGTEAERLETWTGEMFSPEGVAPAGDGRVFVTDTGGGGVLRFEGGRAVLRKENGGGDRGSGPGQLNKPEGVETRDGRIWISDTYNDRILLYRHGDAR
jgi:DNA-binding beta-propeller fold protein YncE